MHTNSPNSQRIEREALIDSLEQGDLIRLNGTLRVVRAVSRGRRRSDRPGNRVSSITLSIMRCSWTRQPYTVKIRPDLYLVDLTIERKGFGCVHGPLDAMLQRQIEDRTPKLLECCDVIGVVA